MIIAGPCSIESEYQLMKTSEELKKNGINFIRGGCWKPRTRPMSFSGLGEEALKIASEVRKKLNIKFAIEVLSPKHVELALKYEMDAIWIGARSTTNPFVVEEIAQALQGVQITTLVKNPMCPDIELWIGAIERLINNGVNDIIAVHRGFSIYPKTFYRNEPIWEIPISLRNQFPNIKLLFDPSHIAGDSNIIEEVIMNAIKYDIYDGFMVETHYSPSNALTDMKQQITPGQLDILLKKINKSFIE